MVTDQTLSGVTDRDWALLVLPLLLCLVVKIIFERQLAEVLEARLERLGWMP